MAVEEPYLLEKTADAAGIIGLDGPMGNGAIRGFFR
jgi:hypothetical protein